MTQIELIQLYGQFQDEAQACAPLLNAHYQHILFALQALIESHGPTSDYQAWLILLGKAKGEQR